MPMQILKQSYFRFGSSEGVITSWESHRTRSFRAEWRMGFSRTLLGEWVWTWWFPMVHLALCLSHGTMAHSFWALLRSRVSPSRRKSQNCLLNLSSVVLIMFLSIHRLPRGLCNVPLSTNEIKTKWGFKFCRPQVAYFWSSLRSVAFHSDITSVV